MAASRRVWPRAAGVPTRRGRPRPRGRSACRRRARNAGRRHRRRPGRASRPPRWRLGAPPAGLAQHQAAVDLVQLAGRLVGQQHLGTDDESAGARRPLHLATGDSSTCRSPGRRCGSGPGRPRPARRPHVGRHRGRGGPPRRSRVRTGWGSGRRPAARRRPRAAGRRCPATSSGRRTTSSPLSARGARRRWTGGWSCPSHGPETAATSPGRNSRSMPSSRVRERV